MGNTAGSARVAFIDTARFYGILLVYYGHFIESVMNQQVAAAATQYKFIYSFHMPLFFLLAGYVAKEVTAETHRVRYLTRLLRGRIVPYIFFATLLIIPTLFISGNHGPLDLSTWGAYQWGLKATFTLGLPVFNIPTWFLLAVCAVEILHLLVGRFFHSTMRLIGGIVVFYLFGTWFCSTFDLYNPVKGRLFSYFYFQEAVVAYSFFLLGFLLKKLDLFKEKSDSGRLALLLSLPLALILYLTYDLNAGQFTFTPYDAVVAMFSSHGNVIWFGVTAVAGSLCILALARGTKNVSLLSYLGGNTLVLFCLNGVFYHFVNDRLAVKMAPSLTGMIELTLAGIAVTICSILLAVPAIPLCNRFVPWLVGYRPGNRPEYVVRQEVSQPVAEQCGPTP